MCSKNSFPEFKSQNLVAPSTLWLISILLSGLKRREVTSALCPSNVRITLAVEISQTRICLSAPAEKTFFPSGLKIATWTAPLCPMNFLSINPVSTFHRRILPSQLAESSCCLSELSLIEEITSLCPTKSRTIALESSSHIFISLLCPVNKYKSLCPH